MKGLLNIIKKTLMLFHSLTTFYSLFTGGNIKKSIDQRFYQLHSHFFKIHTSPTDHAL